MFKVVKSGPIGFESVFSKLNSFIAFHLVLLLPHFTTYKAIFRRKCGVMQYLWFFVLFASILTALVMPMLNVGTTDAHHPLECFQPHHQSTVSVRTPPRTPPPTPTHEVRGPKAHVGHYFHVERMATRTSDMPVVTTPHGVMVVPKHTRHPMRFRHSMHTPVAHHRVKPETHPVSYHGEGMRLNRERRRLAAMARKKKQQQPAKEQSQHATVSVKSHPHPNQGIPFSPAKVHPRGNLRAGKQSSHPRRLQKHPDHRAASHLVPHHHRHGKTLTPQTKVNQRGHLEVRKGTLQSVPDTRWYTDKRTAAFNPSQMKKTDMRIISLKDACYCSRRNKFLLPPRQYPKDKRFPHFVYRYNIAESVPWDKPASLLAFKGQEVVRVPGRTVMWRGRSLSEYQPHLTGSLLAIRSFIDVLQKVDKSPVRFATQSFTQSAKHDVRTSSLHDYYLGDIPSDMIIEVKNLKPKMVCFDEVHAIGSEFENHSLTRETYDHVKDLVEKREKGKLRHHLVKSCKDKTANKQTVYIMDKQEVNGSSGTLTNADAVKQALSDVLKILGLDKTVTIKVVQAPSLPCSEGDEGCGGVWCSEGQSKEDCMKASSVMRDVVGYNNMTFLITTAGPRLDGLMYMPRGSGVVEVIPYGNYDRVHEGLATDAGIQYKRMQNRSDIDVEANLRERFGDIAISPRACWADPECRKARKDSATKVDIKLLKLMVKDQLKLWKETCGVL